MHGENKLIQAILHQGNHYLVPSYQRDYQWPEVRWQSLVRDILIAETQGDTHPPHWLGILLTSQIMQSVHPGFDGQMEYEVIDGQQRLTTLAIWVAALVHHAHEAESRDIFPLSKMARLTVQESDRVYFDTVLHGKWRNAEYFNDREHPILKAYTYFRYLLWLGQDAMLEEDPVHLPKFKKPDTLSPFEVQWQEHVDSKRGQNTPRGAANDALTLLTSTMRKLSIFSLIHNAATDETQAEIFDTLNGRHQELEPLDHVRNSLFVRIENLEAMELYRNYWKPAETSLRSVSLKKMKAGKAFIYDYVISKGEKRTQGTINASKGAAHFATMIKNKAPTEIASFIETDVVPAMLTWQVVVRSQNQITLNGHTRQFPAEALFHMSNIRDLSVGPANPLVLHYALGWVHGKVLDKAFTEILFLIENFLVRQILGGRPMSPLRSRLMDLMGALQEDFTIEKLESALSKSDWVTNKELFEKAHVLNIYESATPRALGAIFRGIERHLSGSGSMKFNIGKGDGMYSIEHIYPQDAKNWKEDLEIWGVAQKDMDEILHVLGNLTVVTNQHNSAVGNKSFLEKKGFPTHEGNAAPLSLNLSWLGSGTVRWTPALVQDRTISLMTAITGHWVSIVS